jgi:hypothetical protein
MAALENKVAAQAPTRTVGRTTFPKTDKFVPKSNFDLAKLEPHEQANAARERMAAIRADPQHPYWDARHPGHNGAVEEMRGLYNAQYMESGEPVLADKE